MKHLKNHLIILSFLFFALPMQAQNWGEKVTYDSVTKYEVYAKTYSYSDTPFLITDIRSDTLYDPIQSFNIKSLTVYRPFDGTAFLNKRPVVFFVHGGGWVDGYSFWYLFASQSLAAEKGWIFVSVDYRITSDSVFIADEYCPDKEHCSDTAHRTKAAWYPDNINDVAEAFQWTYNSIDSLGGDTNNIFIFGHSAGAHLVSLLATATAYQQLRPHIRGVVSMSGAYQIKTLDMYVFGSAIDQTFQGGHENNDEELDDASPWSYIASGLTFPPFQLLHCSMDLPSLPEQKILFTNQLDFFGYSNENVFFNGFSHVTEMTSLEDINSEPSQRIIEFIEAHLYPTGIEENSDADNSELILFPFSPNPVETFTNLHFRLNKNADIIITLFDVSGHPVKKLLKNNYSKGEYHKLVDLTGCAPGIYYCILQSGKISCMQKLIVK